MMVWGIRGQSESRFVGAERSAETPRNVSPLIPESWADYDGSIYAKNLIQRVIREAKGKITDLTAGI